MFLYIAWTFTFCLQDASAKAVQAFTGVAAGGNYLQLRDGRFIDDRWVGGRWDLSKFASANGETDWDAVRLDSRVFLQVLHKHVECADVGVGRQLKDLWPTPQHNSVSTRSCAIALHHIMLLLTVAVPLT
jgi:hypothetical protein